MKCGSCKEKHQTVAEVRACYGVPEKIPVPQEANQSLHQGAPPAGAGDKATEKQLAFISNLQSERDMATLDPDKVVTKREARELIDWLLKFPKTQESVAPSQVKAKTDAFKDIPAGYYATDSLTGNNDLDFWKVDRPTEGKWKGYIFVKRVIGGQPDVNVRKHEKTKILRAIRDADPAEASALFGQKLGMCGKCGRHLTDEQSRAIGIGPVCRDA
jgi:hypothetical protein